MKRFGGDKKYFYWGFTAFAVIAACILLYFIVMQWALFAAGVAKVFRILSPFVWGFVIAYLLRPMMRFFENRFMAPLGAKFFQKSEHRAFVFGRITALILSEAMMVLVVILLLRMVLPQLYSSINNIIMNSSNYYEKIVGWVDKFLTDYPQLKETFVNFVEHMGESIVDWTKTSLLPQMTDLVANITSGVYYFIRGVYYIVIGIIVSVYILFNKEAVCKGAKKVVYSIFSVPFAKKILDGTRFTDKIFMGFISGKIVDSTIIGMLCYICCVILGMPYPVLVSVIIGVTNIIPFFGPLIGAIPSAFIILMWSPLKCLEFIIFILLLQQFDGNVLGPKILGESIGVNGFWVMFAIILGGGLFGFAGMLLGVPVFVVIYTGISTLINRKLKRSGLPTETADYDNLSYFDPDSNEPVPKQPRKEFPERRAERKAAREKKRKNGGGDAPGGGA